MLFLTVISVKAIDLIYFHARSIEVGCVKLDKGNHLKWCLEARRGSAHSVHCRPQQEEMYLELPTVGSLPYYFRRRKEEFLPAQ